MQLQTQYICLSSDRLHISYGLDADDVVYGLGEQVRGINKRGWSYMDENEVREVADQYRGLHIPLDSISLDIDDMDHYRDFTVSAFFTL